MICKRKQWSRAIIIRVIHELYESHEKLNSWYVQSTNRTLYGAACKYFGSWPCAVKAAGLDYATVRIRKLKHRSKTLIVKEVVRRHKAGLSLRGEVVSKEDRGLYQAARRHFGRGGWKKARVLAGFDPVDPDPKQKWTKQAVVLEIRRLQREGVALNTAAMIKTNHVPVYAGGRKVFGTRAKALSAAGINYNEVRKVRYRWWTEDKILKQIRSLVRRGVRLSSKSVRISRGGLFGAAVLKFGSWSTAVERAGISYAEHCRIWSSKAWLRRLSTNDQKQLLHRTDALARKRGHEK